MSIFLLRFLAFAAAITLTLRVQAFWLTDDPFALFFPVVLWLGLITDWTVQQILCWKQKGQLQRGVWVLPTCIAFVLACGKTHAPLRVLFWRRKALLEAAEKQTPQQNFRSILHPFQIAKSKGSTRFLTREAKGLFYKTAFGFAHCPDHMGCKGVSFRDYWENSEETAKHVTPSTDFYWDYSHGTPAYTYVGHGWYATKVSVEDVGD